MKTISTKKISGIVGLGALFFLISTLPFNSPHNHLALYSPHDNVLKLPRSVTTAATAIDENTRAALLQSISEREYFIHYNKKKEIYQSPNRNNGLKTAYQPGIWEMRTRSDTDRNASKLIIKTLGVYADNICIATPNDNATVTNDRNRLDFVYPDFTEQYINNKDGVRQNFIIHKAAEGAKNLHVALQFNGMHAKKFHENILFTKDRQQWLYSDLKAWDAEGRILHAEMKLNENTITLSADIRNATFPVTIDPIVSTLYPGDADAVIEGTQPNGVFGAIVAGAGDVNGDGYSDVIVGAPGHSNGETEEGAAFIYYGSANGIVTDAPVMLEANQAGAAFGASVSGAGDVNGDGFADVIVGAPLFDGAAEDDVGAAFIFLGSATGITQTPGYTFEGDKESMFGASVAGAGDTDADGYSDVIVGAPFYTEGLNKEGAIFVYRKIHSGTPSVAKRESNQADANMGYSVSGAGDVNGDGFSDIIAGVPAYDNGQTDEGVAIIYLGSSEGIEDSPQAILELNQANAAMGTSVSAAGDIDGDGFSDVVIGAPKYDDASANAGSAVVFKGSASGVSTTPFWAKGGSPNAAMGTSVSGAGDINGDGFSDIIISAPHMTLQQSGAGMAMVAYGPDLTKQAFIFGNQAGMAMGIAVSGAGDINGDGYADIVIGAQDYTNPLSNTGAAFTYHGGLFPLTLTSETPDIVSGDEYWTGSSISAAGDVNGDGYADIVVGGGHTDKVTGVSRATILLYYGDETGITLPPVEITQVVGSSFIPTGGSTVSGAGDVNGDGYDDIVVSARDEIYVYHGSAAGIQTTPAIKLGDPVTGPFFGKAIAGVGDVNGDGFADIAAGIPTYSNGQTNEGAIYVYHGSATGIQATPAIILESDQANIRLGASISGAGDVNGDGYADIIAGAPDYENGQTREGAAFIYYGSGSGMNAAAVTIVESNQAASEFGASVSNASDINGDGYADILVGAPAYDNGQTNEGAVFVYYGGTTGITATGFTMLESNWAGAGFGRAVSGLGDGNADGYADIIIGAPFYYEPDPFDPEEPDFGRYGKVYVFNGSPAGIDPVSYATYNGYVAAATPLAFGTAVAGVGDINGDGLDDFGIGSPSFIGMPNAEDYQGENTFWYSTTPKAKAALALYNTGTTTRIQQTNVSDGQFSVGMFFKNPDGRSNGKLVWETKSEGEAFSSSSPLANSTRFTGQQASYTDLGIAGTRLNAIVSKPGFANKIRMRAKYDPVTSLNGQVYGPWIYPPGYFYVQGMNSTPLPVEWISFTARPVSNNQKVQLDWQTVYEKNNAYFSIERSADTKEWTMLKEIQGSGNSSYTQFYQSFDEEPLQGRSYYRIKQTDVDGKTSYSEIRIVNISAIGKVLIYPVPAANLLTVEGDKQIIQQMKIINSAGIQIKSLPIQYSGASKAIINIGRLTPGVYYLQTRAGSYKFVKQ